MKKDMFIDLVAKALCKGRCELFVGSGVSVGAGLPSWKELIRPVAATYAFDVDKSDDLPLIAQYIENESIGNRSMLTQLVSETFGSRSTSTSLHKTIADIGFSRIWTTNYDCLLEDTIRLFSNVLVIKKDADFKQVRNAGETCIVKLHGSSDDLEHIVITKNDYDSFFSTHPLMSREFAASLSEQSILFIGYSYHDPDIQSIMTESRILLNGTQAHFMILKKPSMDECDDYSYELRIHEAWVKELARVGVHVLEIDRYEDLEGVLQEISFCARGNSVFITGSHDSGVDKKFVADITRGLHHLGATLVYGQSSGVGLTYFNSFCEEAVREGVDIGKCTKIYGNPYGMDSGLTGNQDLIPVFKRMRNNLIRDTRVVAFHSGGIGTIAEIELAIEHGCRILPLIADKNDYKNRAVEQFLKNDKCVNQLERFCKEYAETIKRQDVPSACDVIDALRSMLGL